MWHIGAACPSTSQPVSWSAKPSAVPPLHSHTSAHHLVGGRGVPGHPLCACLFSGEGPSAPTLRLSSARAWGDSIVFGVCVWPQHTRHCTTQCARCIEQDLVGLVLCYTSAPVCFLLCVVAHAGWGGCVHTHAQFLRARGTYFRASPAFFFFLHIQHPWVWKDKQE